MSNKFQIIEVNEPKDEYVFAVSNLLGQLSSQPIDFTGDDLLKIINSSTSFLYLMSVDSEIVGMFTLCACLSPTGLKYWLEDVVVDKRYRGNSFGKELVKTAIEQVSAKGGMKLMLTSRPERIIANSLYKSLGFALRNTNVYRMDINKK